MHNLETLFLTKAIPSATEHLVGTHDSLASLCLELRFGTHGDEIPYTLFQLKLFSQISRD